MSLVSLCRRRLPGVLAGVLILTACGQAAEPTPQIPSAALAAVAAEWESLPGSRSGGLEVVRAWPGRRPVEDESALPPEMEVWCVTVRPPDAADQAGPVEPMTWIVVRQNREADWVAAVLMTVSSLWPYEACGSGP